MRIDTKQVVKITIVLLFVSVVAAATPTTSDREAWRSAGNRILANIDGLSSMEGSYTFRRLSPFDNRYVDVQVEFALEGGLKIDGRDFRGKVYQKTTNQVEGSEQVAVFEHGSPGGSAGETRMRSSREPYLKVGVEQMQSCPWPHDAAGWFMLESLIRDGVGELVKVERGGIGLTTFTTRSTVSGVISEIVCDENNGSMPVAFRVYEVVDESGVHDPDQYLEHVAKIEEVRGPDGSKWYYPMSGSVVRHKGKKSTLSKEWNVEPETLKINTNIPDNRFFLMPLENEGMVRARAGTVLVERGVGSSNQVAAGSDAATSSSDRMEDSQLRFGSAIPVWAIPGGVSAALLLAAVILFIYQRRSA